MDRPDEETPVAQSANRRWLAGFLHTTAIIAQDLVPRTKIDRAALVPPLLLAVGMAVLMLGPTPESLVGRVFNVAAALVMLLLLIVTAFMTWGLTSATARVRSTL